MNTHEKTRPVRGLIHLINDLYSPGGLYEKITSGRRLLANSKVLPREWGTCRWCREPSPSKRHLWHEDCSLACHIAHGGIAYTRDWTSASPHWHKHRWTYYCSDCGDSAIDSPIGDYEVDHNLPISIAWQLKRLGARDWWKAWTFQNLRPLCRDCHRVKTKVDKGRLAAIQKIEKGEINEIINTRNYIDLLELP